jgi:hypothetical protein
MPGREGVVRPDLVASALLAGTLQVSGSTRLFVVVDGSGPNKTFKKWQVQRRNGSVKCWPEGIRQEVLQPFRKVGCPGRETRHEVESCKASLLPFYGCRSAVI